MSAPAVVLDSGALGPLTTDKGFRFALYELVEAGGYHPILPTVVLAEAISGGPSDAATNRAVKLFGTVDTPLAVARRAGHLRHAASRDGGRRVPNGIDAIVAAHAAQVGRGVVFTTDPGDFRRLLVDFPRIAVERP